MNYNHEIIAFHENRPIRLFINKIDSIEPHWHQSLEISIVIEGNIVLQASESVYEFKKGDTFLVNSNEIHSLKGKGALLATLQIRLDQLDHLPKNKNSVYFEHDFSSHKGRLIRNIIATLLKNNTANEESSNELLELSLVYKLLFFLFSEGVSQEQRPQSKDSLNRMTSILAYINSEYSKDISLDTIAANEFLSSAYLSRYFKENVGMNFSEYLRNVRLNKAVEYLLSSDLSIDAISAKVGFPNPRAFVYAFKEKYQTNPSIYRKHHSKDNTLISNDEPTDKYRSFNYLDDSFEEDRASVTKFIVKNTEREADINFKNHTILTTEDITVFDLDKHDTSSEINEKKYLKMIGGGRVKDILSAKTQEEIRTLQKEIGFEYIKLHSVFDDDLMVVTKQDGKLVFNFTFIDQAYDFLLSVNLKPLVQLSFMPKALASKSSHSIFLGKSIIGYPKDINEWNKLCSSFLLHLINRYGKKVVESFLFSVWNEPASSNHLFGMKDEEYYSLYKNTYYTLKNIDKKIRFGGPASFSTYGKKDDWLFNFLSFTKKENIVPDFITIHYYDIDLSWMYDPKEVEKDIPNRIYLSPDENSFESFLIQMKGKLKEMGISSPLYITEWNNTVSHKDLLSDTTFKSAYIVKNLLETNNMVSSCSYWSLTDDIDENILPKEHFHGGLGLFTYYGVKKPSYYAYLLLKKLGNTILKKGNGYYVTKTEDDEIRILFYYYVPYNYEYSRQMDYQINMKSRDAFFKDKESKAFQIHLKEFEGEYLETRTELSSESGSAYDVAIRSGTSSLDIMDIDYLKTASLPHMTFNDIKLKGDDYISYELKPLEVLFVTLKKKEK